MKILGIHGGFFIGQHDPSVALCINGKIVFALEEERPLKIKSPRGIQPVESIRLALKSQNLSIKDIDYVVHPGATYGDIKIRLKSFFEHYFKHAPKIYIVNHQLAHLSSAFYMSGFDNATCVSYDAFGDKLSGAIGIGKKNKIKIIKTFNFKNSLGTYYALFTNYMGFDVAEDEYKLMGMAAYGKKIIPLDKVLSYSKKEFYKLNNEYVNRSNSQPTGNNQGSFYSKKFIKEFGPQKLRSEKFLQRHYDLALSAQLQIEKACINTVKKAINLTKVNNLCLAGGVALNCKANGEIRKQKFVNKMFVQPAASDRGLSLGCALYLSNKLGEKNKILNNIYLGPKYSINKIEKDLKILGIKYNKFKNKDDKFKYASKLLKNGKIIGWYNGRSEFGPRALGNRSILANPVFKNMKDKINKKVKFREEFRPFAPVCLEKYAKIYFDVDFASPFMTEAVMVRKKYRNLLRSITHLDGTARLQTVNSSQNKELCSLLLEFSKLSKYPVLLNTSFNIKGQPIVETYFDAISTFFSTGLDYLFIENYLIKK